ncbi:hypothetical protein [Nitrospira sp. Nam80]
MQFHSARQLFLVVALTIICAFYESVPIALAQSGGGAAGGSAGGTGPGAGGGSGAGRGTGKAVVPSSKDPDAKSVNPQLPSGQSQQRDRAQRLEQQLRQGPVNAPSPQTEMSDRLDQLYKNPPAGPSGTGESGK